MLKPLRQGSQASKVVEVNWADRWQVYQRLQELAIPSWCETNQPLQVEINNVTAAIQLWSVIKQSTADRQDLICWLHRCAKLGA